MARVTKHEQEEAIKRLREILSPGDTVFSYVARVSGSGMSRVIVSHKFYTDEKGNLRKWFLSHLISRALGWGYDDKREGVKVSGCGMDMGFHLVYELSGVLFDDSRALTNEWL